MSDVGAEGVVVLGVEGLVAAGGDSVESLGLEVAGGVLLMLVPFFAL